MEMPDNEGYMDNCVITKTPALKLPAKVGESVKSISSSALDSPNQSQISKDLDYTIHSKSASPPYPHKSQWTFYPPEDDLESDDDCYGNTRQIALPRMLDHIKMSSPTESEIQSEGTVITSWDEWDGPSDMLSHIETINVTQEGSGTQMYGSLLDR
jgi:hypothetical protein